MKDNGDKLSVIPLPPEALGRLRARMQAAQAAQRDYHADVGLVAALLSPGATLVDLNLDNGTMTFRSPDIQLVEETP